MPPKRKAPIKKAPPPPTLSGIIDSSDDEVPSPQDHQDEELTAPPKKAPTKPRGRQPKKAADAAETEKPPPKPRGRQPKATAEKDKLTVEVPKEPAKRGRKKAEPEPEPEPESEEEVKDVARKGKRRPPGKKREVEDIEEEEGEDELAQSAPPVPVAARGRKKKGSAVVAPDSEEDQQPPKKVLVKGRGKKVAPIPVEEEEREVPETQYDQMDVDDVEAEVPAGKREIAPTPTQVHSAHMKESVVRKGRRPAKARSHAELAAKETESDEDAFTSSALPPRRGGKRTNGGTTTHAERLQKLEEEREIESEKALREYKETVEAKEAEVEKYIASLKEHLAHQTKLAQECKGLRNKLKTKESDIAKLNGKIKDLDKELAEGKKENSVLSAKFSAQSKNVPGSAIKPHPAAARAAGMGAGSDDAWAAAQKEALFGDLTNLMILNVKKKPEDGSTLFECLQTGVNGALQFKLTVPLPQPLNGKRRPDSNGDERDPDEIEFTPVLDAKRDSHVLSLLPHYLKQNITFKKDQAARFYQKINTILMRAPVQEGQGAEGDGNGAESEEESETEEETEPDMDKTGVTEYTEMEVTVEESEEEEDE